MKLVYFLPRLPCFIFVIRILVEAHTSAPPPQNDWWNNWLSLTERIHLSKIWKSFKGFWQWYGANKKAQLTDKRKGWLLWPKMTIVTDQRRVQQYGHSRALVVLMPGFTLYQPEEQLPVMLRFCLCCWTCLWIQSICHLQCYEVLKETFSEQVQTVCLVFHMGSPPDSIRTGVSYGSVFTKYG